MLFPSPLQEGILEKRYKRFLADVRLLDGRLITAYCPNTGSMAGCSAPGSRVWLSEALDTNRKYPFTWELIQVGDHLVSINTARPNALVEEAIHFGKIPTLSPFLSLQREVKYGKNSRIDLLLTFPSHRCYLEVKNVTLGIEGQGYFPDAKTVRGQKHLEELEAVLDEKTQAVLFFCVQHPGIERVSPADHIDPRYGTLLRRALKAGVQVIAYRADVRLDGIFLTEALPVSV